MAMIEAFHALLDNGLQELIANINLHMIPLFKTQLPLLLGAQLIVAILIGWFGAWLGTAPKVNTRSLLLYR